MKQTRPSTAFVKNHSEWLAQFDSGELLSTLPYLYESSGIYIVDKNQQVLYWSLGMETLSGIRREDVIGKNLALGAEDEASAIRKALGQSHDQVGMAASITTH